jgi:MoaA/NifB/PqqE/SkfB family radical SAM enzyme
VSDVNDKIKSKATIELRQNLGDIIPLDTPFVVEMGVTSYCNLKCKFCFHYNNTFEKHTMSFDLFKKIVDGFKGFRQKLKKFKLCGYGENLLVKELPEMIAYLKSSGITEYIELTTNGTLLTPELGRRLIDNGLNQINISLESVTDNGYCEIAGKRISVANLRNVLKQMYEYKLQREVSNNGENKCIIYIKIIDKNLKDKTEDKLFYKLFTDCADYLFVEKMIDMWLDQTNDTISALSEQRNVYDMPIKNNYVCPFIFNRFIIHADGLCVPCCADWNKKYVIGDLKTQSAYEIWISPQLRILQLAHLKHNKEIISICNGCHVYDLNCPDNIDGYERKILRKMGEM